MKVPIFDLIALEIAIYSYMGAGFTFWEPYIFVLWRHRADKLVTIEVIITLKCDCSKLGIYQIFILHRLIKYYLENYLCKQTRSSVEKMMRTLQNPFGTMMASVLLEGEKRWGERFMSLQSDYEMSLKIIHFSFNYLIL